jgi:hypothetical protein
MSLNSMNSSFEEAKDEGNLLEIVNKRMKKRKEATQRYVQAVTLDKRSKGVFLFNSGNLVRQLEFYQYNIPKLCPEPAKYICKTYQKDLVSSFKDLVQKMRLTEYSPP